MKMMNDIFSGINIAPREMMKNLAANLLHTDDCIFQIITIAPAIILSVELAAVGLRPMRVLAHGR